MKKKAIALVLASLLITGVVSAASINGDFKGNPIVKVNVDGKELKVHNTPAIIYNGNTLVPIYMLRDLGAIVEWDPKTYSVNVTLPTDDSLTDRTIDEIPEILVWLRVAKRQLNESGEIFPTLEFILDEKGAYFLAKMNSTGLSGADIQKHAALVSLATNSVKYPTDGIYIETYANNVMTGTIYVSTANINKYSNSEISFSDFMNTWKITSVNK